METIRFFKDKPKDFLILIVPKLKPLNLYGNDILFSQGDQAEEIFFNLKGEVVLYVDISEFVDLSIFISIEKCFNLPISVYSTGSYFGDNDVLA